MIEWQLTQAPEVTRKDVADALSELVLREEDALLAGLAALSTRSLFVYGPAGNGKTSLGRMLHNALRGDLWIPHCIGIEENIIRVFDPQLHQAVEVAFEQPWTIDQRWVRIRRPLIVGGSEMTLESFDLIYSRSLRYYEAPLHVKANGGTFLIDDYGRQRIDPHRALEPLDHPAGAPDRLPDPAYRPEDSGPLPSNADHRHEPGSRGRDGPSLFTPHGLSPLPGRTNARSLFPDL